MIKWKGEIFKQCSVSPNRYTSENFILARYFYHTDRTGKDNFKLSKINAGYWSVYTRNNGRMLCKGTVYTKEFIHCSTPTLAFMVAQNYLDWLAKQNNGKLPYYIR